MLEAASIGLLVPPVFDRFGSATVLAAFERSFYLQAGDDLFAIGAASLHDGPLNIRLRAGDGRPALIAGLGIETGQRWTVGRRRLQRSDGLAIHLDSATIWRPPPVVDGLDDDCLMSGLTYLRRRLTEISLPEDGLIRLCLDPPTPKSLVEHAAALPLSILRRSLSTAFAGAIEPNVQPAIDLLGLGPGLTPSGDDALGGALITCHRLGKRVTARRIADAVLAAAPERTTAISRAHLKAAAQGYAAAPLHDLLEALLADKPRVVNQTLDAAAKIGHSSGLDSVAGMVLALTAWLPRI